MKVSRPGMDDQGVRTSATYGPENIGLRRFLHVSLEERAELTRETGNATETVRP